MTGAQPPLKVMLSTTVYRKKDLIRRISGTLTAFGYEVIVSQGGTMLVNPLESAYDSCLEAVESCDIFLGFIHPDYGSGKSKIHKKSITHRELNHAIALRKLRFTMAHEQVVLARRLLLDLGFDTPEKRKALTLCDEPAIIDDLRLIDMYNDATLDSIPIDDRKGNWVQPFAWEDEIFVYLTKQFSDYARMEGLFAAWQAQQEAKKG